MRNKTRLFNVSTGHALGGGTFDSYVLVDDDEAFLLDGLDTSLGDVACAVMPPSVTHPSTRPASSQVRRLWAS